MSKKRNKQGADREATRKAKPAPHGNKSCSMAPADECPNRGDCMQSGCTLHGRTGR